jgi:hypothetical protein
MRNTKAVGQLLALNNMATRFRTAVVGHDGLPVYTTFCQWNEVAEGIKLAEVVCTLHQQHVVQLQSIAVVLDLRYNNRLERKFAELFMSFYESLGTRYMDNTRGQQYSLIPLPLFSLDTETHSKRDLEIALEMLETWMRLLREFFKRSHLCKMKDSHKFWEDAVDTLLQDMLTVTESSSSSRAPASEKVRSILFHLLLKLRVEVTSETSKAEQVTEEGKRISPSEIFEKFQRKWQDLLESEKTKMKHGQKAKKGEEHTSDLKTNGLISDVEALGYLLKKKRFRFVQILQVKQIQGCDFDIIVTCLMNRRSSYSKGLLEGELFLSLSRSKLLSIVIVPNETEESAKEFWKSKCDNCPWNDWSEFGQTSD